MKDFLFKKRVSNFQVIAIFFGTMVFQNWFQMAFLILIVFLIQLSVDDMDEFPL